MRIVFLGDSLTAGFGVGAEYAFPALVEAELQEAGFDISAQNAGVSGDTSAGALRRLSWILKRPADLLVLAIGANDALRGLPVGHTRSNIERIIDSARQENPAMRILLAGMQAPPSMGVDFVTEFNAIYEAIAAEKKVCLIPFLLEGVAANDELNLPDRIHPNVKGHRVIASNLFGQIRQSLLIPEKCGLKS